MKRFSAAIFSFIIIMATITPAFAETTFKDVKEPSWYSDAVEYVVESGMMTGVGDNQFDPNGMVTRAQVVQILYAKEGKPKVMGTGRFLDVPSNKWYTNAIQWSNSHGIVAGYPDQTFRPDQTVTREQLVLILYQYARFKGLDISTGTDGALRMEKYADQNQVSAYAKTAVAWALEKGIISGTDNGIEPKGTANRAQMAVIIRAFCENIEKPHSRTAENDSDDPVKSEETLEDGEEIIEGDSEVPRSDPADHGDETRWELPLDIG